MSNSKRCTKCSQIKSLDLFTKDKHKKSGYKSSCLQCAREYAKLARTEGRVRRLPYADWSTEQKAKHLARYRAWAAANPDKRQRSSQAHRLANRDYYAERQAQYRAENPEKYKEWQKQNPDKVIANWTKRRRNLVENGIFVINKKEIRKLLQSPCFYCQSPKSGTIDHVMPLSKGGRHSIGNLLPACMPCNQSKRASLLIEWRIRREQKRLGEVA